MFRFISLRDPYQFFSSASTTCIRTLHEYHIQSMRGVVRAAGTSVGHLVQHILYYVSDVEAVLYTLSLHLPVMYAAFLLCIPPSLCYHRETTTYREVPSTKGFTGLQGLTGLEVDLFTADYSRWLSELVMLSRRG
jgi:hypothetical protein